MPNKRSVTGFTLVEIAVVLLVITVLAGTAISAFRAQTAYTRTAQVREQIREAREALINYAIVNQQLPCAAPDEKGEHPPLCPPQPPQKGFLPWKDLGLVASDPWGRPLRYLVTRDMTISSKLNLSTPGSLTVWSGTTNIDPPHAIAFAVWSTGEDGLDASTNNASGTPVVDNDSVVAETPGADDVVEWVSRYVLFGRMMAAGRTLPLTSSSSSASSSSSSASSPAS